MSRFQDILVGIVILILLLISFMISPAHADQGYTPYPIYQNDPHYNQQRHQTALPPGYRAIIVRDGNYLGGSSSPRIYVFPPANQPALKAYADIPQADNNYYPPPESVQPQQQRQLSYGGELPVPHMDTDISVTIPQAPAKYEPPLIAEETPHTLSTGAEIPGSIQVANLEVNIPRAPEPDISWFSDSSLLAPADVPNTVEIQPAPLNSTPQEQPSTITPQVTPTPYVAAPSSEQSLREKSDTSIYVESLQRDLKKKGYYDGEITGLMSESLAIAITAYHFDVENGHSDKTKSTKQASEEPPAKIDRNPEHVLIAPPGTPMVPDQPPVSHINKQADDDTPDLMPDPRHKIKGQTLLTPKKADLQKTHYIEL